MLFTMIGVPDLPKHVAVTHCIKIASERGRVSTIFIQDSIVPGIKTDAKVGEQIEIFADLLGYRVEASRDRNEPIMMINRFEPETGL